MTPLFLALLALGCNGGDTDPPPGDDTAATDDTGSVDDTGDAPDVCADLPALPLDFTTIRGFSGSEDFAFDGDGGLVSVGMNGLLTSRKRDGTTRVIAPGFGEMAGTAYAPNGDLIMADAGRGALLRVTPNGGSETLHGGLSYPNGVAVDPDGIAFTADQNTGAVWRVDTATGDAEQIAADLFAPNGVAIGGDGTLYVGSFGGGTVHRIAPEGDSYAAPELLSQVVEIDLTGGCETAGDDCTTNNYALGTCVDGDEGLTCSPTRDTEACVDRARLEACTTTLFGEPIESRCMGSADLAFCPFTPVQAIEPCDDKDQGQRCRIEGQQGECYQTSQGINACYVYATSPDYGCDGASAGDDCALADTHYPYVGTCVDWGGGDLACDPGGTLEGGLDGIGVDACDNVYVTEYISGQIWRITPEGETEVAVALPSSWIPNMHWGSGLEGWETDVLYVMDRDEGRVFEVQVGVGAKVPNNLPPATE